MLSVLPKRPVSPSLPSSPNKRTKTPSPQKPIYKGIYTPTKTSFLSHLNQVTLMSPASIPVKKCSDSGYADIDPFGKSLLSFLTFSGTKDHSIIPVDLSMTTETDISVEKGRVHTTPGSLHEHSDSLDIPQRQSHLCVISYILQIRLD